MNPLRRDDGEAFGEVVAQLSPKNAQCPRACPVALRRAVREDVLEQIFVLTVNHCTHNQTCVPSISRVVAADFSTVWLMVQ